MTDDGTDGVTIPARKAVKLIEIVENAAKAVKRINDGKNGEVRAASQEYGVTREMVALMKRLKSKSAEDLADWRDEFDHWWKALGLDERAASAPRFSELSHKFPENEEDVDAAA